VKIIYSDSTVQIYRKYDCIATQHRQLKPYQYTTLNEHLPATHQFVRQWDAQTFLDNARVVGTACQAYVQQVLDQRHHPEQAYKTCMGILSLTTYGNERLEKACQRALDFEVYSYHTLKNMLEKGWDKMTETPAEDTPIIPLHPNIRGKDYYQ